MNLLVKFALLIISGLLAATAQTTIKKAPVDPVSPASGANMYASYCAACHGKDARGYGPAANALKVPPPDLTTLTARNHNKFPEPRVYNAIRGDSNLSAHGSKDMPVWGSLFEAMSHGNEAEVQMRISNLVDYLKSVQRQ
jgi:mono/diheme cytochrome c family protein